MPAPLPLQPGKYYHVYNRGNNRENIFVAERNYPYFLKLYAKYVEPVAETYAYCLLRNHFHFLLRIREEEALAPLQPLARNRGGQSGDPSQHFSNLFNAYTRAFNAEYQRTGALFQRPFGRIEVTTDAYFLQLIAYIHQNPQKHRFVADFRDWPYSSYHAHLSDKPTRLKRDEVLVWFNGAEGFTRLHKQIIKPEHIEALAPEDFD